MEEREEMEMFIDYIIGGETKIWYNKNEGCLQQPSTYIGGVSYERNMERYTGVQRVIPS